MRNKISAFENLNFETITTHKPEYRLIEWTSIDFENDLNIRSPEKYTDDPELHDLAYSIIKFGLRQPIILYRDREKKNFYKIWHGQRRFSAIKMIHTQKTLNYYYNDEPYVITEEDRLNITKIPGIILPEPEDNSQRILRQIAENEHRKDIDNLELCKQYHELLNNNPEWNQDTLSKNLGKSKQLISDICGLKRIDHKIHKLISEIQLYGFTLRKYEQLCTEGEDPIIDEKPKKAGIKQLRKIASSFDQVQTFWEFFGNRCNEKDAEYIEFSEKEKTKAKPENTFKLINNDYMNLSLKLEKAPDKNKDKIKVKKAFVAKNIIKYLMLENDLTLDDLK